VGRIGTTSGCGTSHLQCTSSCHEPELIPDLTTFDIKGTMHPRGINAVCWVWDQAWWLKVIKLNHHDWSLIHVLADAQGIPFYYMDLGSGWNNIGLWPEDRPGLIPDPSP